MRIALSILSFLAVLIIADHLLTGGQYTEAAVTLLLHSIRAIGR